MKYSIKVDWPKWYFWKYIDQNVEIVIAKWLYVKFIIYLNKKEKQEKENSLEKIKQNKYTTKQN